MKDGAATEGCRLAGRFVIGADHPSLPGHFPGRPVVPGVVLLDHAVALTGVAPAGLLGVKFLAAVGPGEVIEVTTAAARAGRIGFTGWRGAEVVFRGQIVPRPAST